MARITYNTTTVGGKLVAQAVANVRNARDELNRVVAMMNSMTAGGVTPALLESSAEFGVAVGQGANFYAAINNMKANTATVSDSAIGDIDNGG